jgi:hypothetical protein
MCDIATYGIAEQGARVGQTRRAVWLPSFVTFRGAFGRAAVVTAFAQGGPDQLEEGNEMPAIRPPSTTISEPVQ